MTDLEQAVEFLKTQNILTLSTLADGELPWSTPLFYLLRDDLRIYWVSSRSSLHSRSLAATQEVSIAVHAATDQWKEIRGVQMRGTVRTVESPQERKEVLAAYATRFKLGGILRVALNQSEIYKFSPSWLRYLDNSKRFGYKREIHLTSDQAE